MKILAVDTSHGVCSVALSENGKIISAAEESENSRQAERLVAIIEELLNKNSLKYTDLAAIAVNIGPGSFTGVRIGMAAVNGLRLVNNTPLIGITSLQSVAAKSLDFADGRAIMTVLDAKRGQVYMQIFDSSLNPLSEAQMLDYEQITDFLPNRPFVATGDGTALIKDFLRNNENNFITGDETAQSCAPSIARIATDELAQGHVNKSLSPFYIRPPDAKIPTK